MKLNAAEVKYLKCPPDKAQFKKADGKGLFILVKKSGSKLWRYKYTFGKKAQEMSLGAYPVVSLADARKAHESAKVLLNQGINPSRAKQEEKIRSIKQGAIFNDVAIQWWDKQKEEWSEPYANKVKKYIDGEFKHISKFPLDRIDYSIISKTMLDIEVKGNPKKASVALSIVNRILNHAKARQLIEVNPTTGMSLADLLGPVPKVIPRAAILNVKHLNVLINDIEDNELGTLISRAALKLIPHIFLRPGEVSCIKWAYIDDNIGRGFRVGSCYC